MRPTDLYLVHLGYVNSVAADGQEQVIWVISQQRPVSATSWQLNNRSVWACPPNTAGKQWRWYVEVVESAWCRRGVRSAPPAPFGGSPWQYPRTVGKPANMDAGVRLQNRTVWQINTTRAPPGDDDENEVNHRAPSHDGKPGFERDDDFESMLDHLEDFEDDDSAAIWRRSGRRFRG